MTRCPGSVAGCQRALLALLNQDRARYHVGPLLLDEVQSDGTRRCIGALGHSRHMAAQGQISHDDFPSDICGPHQLAGENVGVAQGWSEFFSLHRLDRMMMAEGSPRPGCTGTHACNIINPGFRTVGIGIVKIGSAFWLTEDFKG
ncbi:MAG TPA: hypothetical protein VKX16_00465 [Chloroflexota bacterium]|nr:hypothetical protein [Chloroflexota bacterium]